MSNNTKKISFEVNENEITDPLSNDNQLSNELSRLNELHQNGVLTKEEFEKAKQKILDY